MRHLKKDANHYCTVERDRLNVAAVNYCHRKMARIDSIPRTSCRPAQFTMTDAERQAYEIIYTFFFSKMPRSSKITILILKDYNKSKSLKLKLTNVSCTPKSYVADSCGYH